jgi:hypothetical protein
MTEFTQAGIDRLRDIMNDGGEYWSRSLALDALDEIERLQDLMLAYENDLVLVSVYGKLKRAEERIEELEAERRWIPVSERLPENGERVLVRMSNFYIVIACYFYKNGYWKNDSGQEIFIVTHWQPLPQPPKDGE